MNMQNRNSDRNSNFRRDNNRPSNNYNNNKFNGSSNGSSENNNTEKQKGIVKFFDPKKGFGFISFQTKHGEKDIFVHCSALMPICAGLLNQGDKVCFFISKGRQGFEAQEVENKIAE